MLTSDSDPPDTAAARLSSAHVLSGLAHDLRAPINSLLMLARMLADDPNVSLPPRQLEFVRAMQASSVDLLALVNDVIDVARLEVGTLAFETVRVPLVPLCADIEHAVRPVIESRGLELVARLADDLPETIETDPKRLQQVLERLLRGAASRSWQGAVTFEVARDGERVTFRVIDSPSSGPGHSGDLSLAASLGDGVARRLGGALRDTRLDVGAGHVFTLILPMRTVEPPR